MRKTFLWKRFVITYDPLEFPNDGDDTYYGSRLNLMVTLLSEKDSSFDRSGGPTINDLILS